MAIAAAVGVIIFPASSRAEAAAPTAAKPGLARCVRTPHRAEKNYYEDLRSCSSGKNWTLVVEAESNTLGRSCVGPVDQSFLVNGAKSPVTLRWIRSERKSLTDWGVDMKVDTSSGTICSNQYTFFSFMDHVEHGGGHLPALGDLHTSHALSYTQTAQARGEARLTFGAQAFWDGRAHILEVLPAKIGYRANPGFPPGVIQKIVTPKFEYVILDDSWGLRVKPDGLIHNVDADWAALFSKAIDLNLFARPTGETAVQAVYVAVETHNRAMASLHQEEFDVLGKH
jgi:hypothetical protein